MRLHACWEKIFIIYISAGHIRKLLRFFSLLLWNYVNCTLISSPEMTVLVQRGSSRALWEKRAHTPCRRGPLSRSDWLFTGLSARLFSHDLGKDPPCHIFRRRCRMYGCEVWTQVHSTWRTAGDRTRTCSHFPVMFSLGGVPADFGRPIGVKSPSRGLLIDFPSGRRGPAVGIVAPVKCWGPLNLPASSYPSDSPE